MKNYLFLLLLFIIACNGNKKNQAAESNNITVATKSGESLYISCIACHGESDQGNKELEAPSIAGLDDWYISRQLEKFKSGHRGDVAVGTNAVQMISKLCHERQTCSVQI